MRKQKTGAREVEHLARGHTAELGLSPGPSIQATPLRFTTNQEDDIVPILLMRGGRLRTVHEDVPAAKAEHFPKN